MGLLDQLFAARMGAGTQGARLQGAQQSPMPAPGQSAVSGAPAPPPPPQPPGMAQRLQGLGQQIAGSDAYQNTVGNEEWRARKLAALNSMRYAPDAGIAQMAAQRLQTAQEQRRLTGQANRTAEVLRAAGQEELAGAVEANPEQAAQLYGEYLKTKLNPADSFTTMTGQQVNETLGIAADPNRLYNYNKATGKITEVGGKGTTINMPPSVGTPASGFQNVFDDQGRVVRQEMIPGGPADLERQELEDKARGRAASTQRAGQTVVQDITRAEALLGDIVRGDGIIPANLRATRAKIKGTPEWNFNQFKESALSNVGLDTLQQMRENSPTGGALGQVPIQQQTRLEQVLGSLNVEQDPTVLQDNLARVRNIYIDIMYGDADERRRAVEAGKLDPGRSAEVDAMYTELSFDEMGRPRQPAEGAGTGKRLIYNPRTGELEDAP